MCNLCQASVSRLATPGNLNLSNDCQMPRLCPLLFRSSLVWELAQGLSEEAQGIHGAKFELCKLAPAVQVALSLALTGRFLLLLLNSLSTFLPRSTYVQGLKCSLAVTVEGSTKLGQVRIGQGYFLSYSLTDSPYSDCQLSYMIWLSDLSPILNRASRTIMETANMSPL